jgi:hypothetical protein
MQQSASATSAPLIGVQTGAISFVDEGTGKVLDIMQELGSANAVFISTQSFDRGLQGRQVPGRPYPGHGPDGVDDHHGGSYVTQHAEYYGNTVLGPFRARDAEVAEFDVLAEVIPEAQERGIAVYSFVLENTHSGLTKAVPNWPKVLQLDAHGRRDAYACLRNPDYVAWWLGLIEDQVKTYPIDGLMFGGERNGPLGNVLGNGGFARDGGAYCFCEHCISSAQSRGIDADRAREGYLALERLARGEATASRDSGFVLFLRLLLHYPEILAWEQHWHQGYESLQRQIYGTVKFLNPQVSVGWHVWHHNSFSPLYRAQMDFGAMAAYSDFVKPVVYHSCGGYRLQNHIHEVRESIFRGVDEQSLYDLYRQVLGYGAGEASFDELTERGLTTDYVGRETARAVDALDGAAAVYPGIDLDVSSPDFVHKTTPETAAAALVAALDNGADGVVLSRKYSEMRLENLAAVGAAVRAR